MAKKSTRGTKLAMSPRPRVKPKPPKDTKDKKKPAKKTKGKKSYPC